MMVVDVGDQAGKQSIASVGSCRDYIVVLSIAGCVTGDLRFESP